MGPCDCGYAAELDRILPRATLKTRVDRFERHDPSPRRSWSRHDPKSRIRVRLGNIRKVTKGTYGEGRTGEKMVEPDACIASNAGRRTTYMTFEEFNACIPCRGPSDLRIPTPPLPASQRYGVKFRQTTAWQIVCRAPVLVEAGEQVLGRLRSCVPKYATRNPVRLRPRSTRGSGQGSIQRACSTLGQLSLHMTVCRTLDWVGIPCRLVSSLPLPLVHHCATTKILESQSKFQLSNTPGSI